MKHILLSLVVLVMAAVVARAADLTPDQITKAQQLFTTGCLKCHPKHGGDINPKAFSNDAKWGRMLNDMLRTAKISGDDAQLLTDYLSAVRFGKVELPKTKAPAKCGK
jgi:hypothetical protein